MRYEYTIVVHSFSVNDSGKYLQVFEDTLNEYGSKGWRYVESDMSPSTGYEERLQIMFEREVWPEDSLENESDDDVSGDESSTDGTPTNDGDG